VLLLKHNNRFRWFSAVPVGSKIAVSTGELVKRRSVLTSQMRLYLTLPEVEAFTFRNPARGRAHIDNDKLNKTRSKELPDTLFGE
jgi:hypothetical protein